MTTRNVQTFILIDEDIHLPVEKSLVHKFEDVVTQDDQQTTILQLMVDNDIKGILDKHNEMRTSTVNQTVLERTGKKVMLQPVSIKDLTWKVR